MENKYITVAYKLYVMQDGQKTLVEEATVEHPFQFISGLGTTLERFETEITALKKGDKFEFVIPTAEAYGEYMPEGVRTVSKAVSYTHLRAHETDSYLVCRLLLEKKKTEQRKKKKKQNTYLLN